MVLAVVLLGLRVDAKRAAEVLLVVEPADVQRRHRGSLQPRLQRAGLPVGVVVRVGDEVVPRRQRVLEVQFVGVREWAELQVPVVGVEAVELEVEVRLLRPHQRRVLEPVAEAKRAVVVKVVAEKHVHRRRLRGRGPERRVRLGERHRRQPARVADAEHADAAVVVRDLLQQPVDGVVRVRRLVHRLRVVRIAARPRHHERAFRLVAPADVLVGEGVPVVGQFLHVVAEVALGPAVDAVGRADEDDGHRPVGLLRDVNRGVELHPVAHRHHDLAVVEPRVVLSVSERREGEEQQERNRTAHGGLGAAGRGDGGYCSRRDRREQSKWTG